MSKRKDRILPRIPPTTLIPSTVEAFLLAFGDNDYPLSETVRILDEITTDYIIETCHEAASVAHHARRAKIKLDDFKFMLRRDTVKLGRVSDMLETDKELKRKRKAFDTDEGAVLGKGDKDDGGGGGGGGEGEAKGVEKVRRKKGDEEGGERKKRKKKKDAVGDDASTVMGDE
jgi:transcription initiation factor TFIID subunit 13